jgi:hypothetical protein
VLAAPAFAQPDLDCADFDSQADAQKEFESTPGDPHGLDRDNDGEACETHTGYTATSDDSSDDDVADDFTAPERAELGGGGGEAGGVDLFMAFAAVAGALLSFAGAAYVASRRR